MECVNDLYGRGREKWYHARGERLNRGPVWKDTWQTGHS